MLIYVMNFLLAISTTIGMTIIPILCTESLGLSLVILGVIEGTTEFLSNVLRILNGWLFDRVKNKKALFIFANIIAVCSKLLLLMPMPLSVFMAKIAERLANGAFSTPRDAYVGVMSKNKGKALSNLAVSKSAGCILGPLLVGASTLWLGGVSENISFFVFICAAMTSSSLLMSFCVKNIESTTEQKQDRSKSTNNPVMPYSTVLPLFGLAFLFFLARFNDGALMLFLKDEGLPEWFYLSTISVFNGMMLAASPFLGRLIDKNMEKWVFVITFVSMILFSLAFLLVPDASANFVWIVSIAGLLLWGVQRTGSQLVFLSSIIKSVPKERVGICIGLFYIISGLGTMIASTVCGSMMQENFLHAFIWSGGFSGVCLFLFIIFARKFLSKKE